MIVLVFSSIAALWAVAPSTISHLVATLVTGPRVAAAICSCLGPHKVMASIQIRLHSRLPNCARNSPSRFVISGVVVMPPGNHGSSPTPVGHFGGWSFIPSPFCSQHLYHVPQLMPIKRRPTL